MQDIEELISKMNILVVDDMEAIRGLVKSCLMELGAKNVYLEYNGERAWKRLNETKIHLIISDFDMPKVTGLELLKQVRFSENCKHIPFVMLTGEVDKKQVMQCIKEGASDYISKPFQPKDLCYRIIKLLAKIKV